MTTVGDLMGPPFPSVHHAESVVAAARRLRAHAVPTVPVQGDNGELLGMLSARAIVDRWVADARDPRTTSAGSLIGSPGPAVRPDDEAGFTVLNLILGLSEPVLPVVEEGQLVGLITLDVLADHLVDTFDDDRISMSEPGRS
jgi:CBS domain-containing protein